LLINGRWHNKSRRLDEILGGIVMTKPFAEALHVAAILNGICIHIMQSDISRMVVSRIAKVAEISKSF
jgi:hypothetical protein